MSYPQSEGDLHYNQLAESDYKLEQENIQLKQEIERLKGLIEENVRLIFMDKMHTANPTFIDPIWQQFKTENNL